jgi:hypothetical protein
MHLRPRFFLLLAATLGLLAGCAQPPTPVPPDPARELRRGRLYAAALIRETRAVQEPDSVPVEAALALGYLERLRLGMGSPFRMAEQALADPRLPDSLRAPLAWAVLARTLDGRAYEVYPEALEPLGMRGYGGVRGDGATHLELIGSVVEEARDPRAAELAVRMAYAIAAAAGDAGRKAPTVATRAAAQLRDRRLAREDALALLRAADSARVSPLELLPAWRSGRRFRVEAPKTLPLDADGEREAMRAALALAARLRTVAEQGPERPDPAPVRHPGLLGPAAAARLAESAALLDIPPQSPVATTVHSFREVLLAGVLPETERFVAELSVLRHAGTDGPGPEGVALAVGVALRSLAQEPVWFPGLPAPTARELRTRFGLASVTFADEVPEAWRPYYLRMLEVSLRDLALVFPSFTVQGLRVRFGEAQREDALATHDPGPRTLTLPPATSAGTLAHELAHDLDWQAARARYGVRGTYRTDRAVRFRGDHLAAAVRSLAAAPLEPPGLGPGDVVDPSRRPAEVFARNVDWFVAASLARRGLSNGYLTSVQDAHLTGYAAAAPPDAQGTSAAAVARILGEVAPVPDEDLRWFLERFGPGHVPPAAEAVRAVLEDPLPAEDAARTACAPGAAGPVLREDPLRGRLTALAARARARGEALEQAERIAGREGRSWMTRKLDGLLWSPVPVDSATAEMLDPLVRRAEPGSTGAGLPLTESPFALAGAECAAHP